MLKKYYPEQYPECIKSFSEGILLKEAAVLPFVLNRRGFRSRDVLEHLAEEKNIRINCVMEMTQQDLHFMMTSRNYGACVTWSMYLSHIHEINMTGLYPRLHAFPIRDLNYENRFCAVALRSKILPSYAMDLVTLIREDCKKLAEMKLSTL